MMTQAQAAVRLLGLATPGASIRWLTEVTGVSTGYMPHIHQAEIHRSLKRFNVIVAHRRFGKTVLAINALVDAALRFDKHSRGQHGYLAPYQRQAKRIAWRYLISYAMTVPGTIKNESELWVEFPNGNRVSLYGADNAEAIRGLYFDGIVCDEVADFKPYVWGEIIRPAIADRKGWVIFIGTPRGMNHFYELYEQALQDPTWFSALYRADETSLPWLDEKELELARATMSPNQYRQEWLSDFSSSTDNTLITIDQVCDAAKRHIHLKALDGSPKILGVDVARFGDDRSVIIRRQGLVAFSPKIYSDIDNMDLAGRVAQEIHDFEPDAVFIDGGRGEGVIDRLRQLNHDVIEVQFGGKATSAHYANKRAEMWDATAEWLAAGGAIPNLPELKTDLVVPTYSMKSGDKMELESKDAMKKRGQKSPDIGDALALTFAHPVLARTGPITPAWMQPKHQAAKSNYDPYA